MLKKNVSNLITTRIKNNIKTICSLVFDILLCAFVADVQYGDMKPIM